MKPGVSKSVNLGMNSVGVRHMNGGSLKIKRPTSQALGLVSNRLPSNKINKTSIKVKVETPPRLDKINHDMVKVGLISAGLVSAFLLHRLFFWKLLIMIVATPIIRSLVFSEAHGGGGGADHWSRSLENKPTVEPMRPGRLTMILLPIVLKPSSTPLTTDLRPLDNAPILSPIVVPTARTTAETV